MKKLEKSNQSKHRDLCEKPKEGKAWGERGNFTIIREKLQWLTLQSHALEFLG